ncbi:putative pectate lyase E [Elsinoe australis]|uniref:Pectate lyase n=1 Tax=Elsinoe australis TaxID=40998 RepID=A0A4U7AKI3_9PEZI|nr:putative pectate lyase E [Elsinoe australis]
MRFETLALFASAAAASPAGRIFGRALNFNIPASAGVVNYDAPEQISGTFDGGLKTYGRSNVDCSGQSEGGEAAAVFILANGATLKNAIIGENQAEGVYCSGSCTIENVWWTKVCEDALSAKGDGNVLVRGGGARGASDKVIQHNGVGTVTLDGFKVTDFGALYRSCGNCDGNGGARNVVLRNVQAENGNRLVGINTNFGDKATITGSCATSVGEICLAYEGTTGGGEPTEIGPCQPSSLPAC